MAGQPLTCQFVGKGLFVKNTSWLAYIQQPVLLVSITHDPLHISLTFDWQPNIINPKYTPVWAISSTYSKAIGNIGGTGQQRSVAQNPILVPIVKFSWGGVGYLYLHNLFPLSF